jgi:predicted amidohydrolase
MKICVAQIEPVKGDIEINITNHKKLIALAVSSGADVIIFPELSLTGYEPYLAKALATDINDKRFDELQQISNVDNITIGAGMPIKNDAGIYIGMIIFQPDQPRQLYTKKYLHTDEEPFFIPGKGGTPLMNNKIALAICYEVFVPKHPEDAFKNGATIYIASVAKSAAGVTKANQTLPANALTYSMTVFMANSTGFCDNFISAGSSAIWNNKGKLLAQLDDTSEGILIIDTITQEIISEIL